MDKRLKQVPRLIWLLSSLILTVLAVAVWQQLLFTVSATHAALPSVTLETGDLRVQKTVTPLVIFSGETVTYTFVITNAGQITITDIAVEDDHLGSIATFPFTLKGETARTFTVPVTITSSTHNNVTATGSLLTDTLSTLDEAYVTVITPSIALQAWPVPTNTFSGDKVTYYYQITNSGNITLTDMVVRDDVLDIGANLDELDVNGGRTLTVVATLTHTTASPTIVTATHPLGRITDTTHVMVTVYYQIYLPIATQPHQWQPIGQPPVEVNTFYAVTTCGEHLLGGTEQGAFAFVNNQWQHQEEIPSRTVYSILFKPGTCTEVYLTTRGDGLWHGVVQNNVWEWQRIDDDAVASALTVIIKGHRLYVGGDFGLKWSDDWGHSWQTAFTNPIIRLSMDASTQDLLAAVWNSGVYYQDRFDYTNWLPLGVIADPLVYQAVSSQGNVVGGTQSGLFVWQSAQWTAVANFPQTTFAVAATEEAFYAGQRNNGVLRSLDGGTNWHLLNNGLTMSSGEEFQIRHLHIGQDGYLYIGTTNGVWRWSQKVEED